MQTYALTSAGVACPIIAGPDGFDPAACYKGPIPTGAAWIACPDDTLPGDTYDGTTWTKAPRPAVPITKLTFLRRFTAEERIAIRASTDPIIVDFLQLLDMASEVRVDDPDTVAALNYFEAQELLAAGRAAEILA